jgi:hypothetical protein
MYIFLSKEPTSAICNRQTVKRKNVSDIGASNMFTNCIIDTVTDRILVLGMYQCHWTIPSILK